jgi:hypothetical protein
MTNQELLARARTLAGEERKIASQVIELLREIDQRRLHFEMGYPSLQAFCEKELGYSSGAAARRIASMRLVREMPETRPMLEDGRLSLETMQAVQIHFRKEKLSNDEKRALVESVQGKSKREVDRIIQPERTYTITLSEAEYEKLQELKVRMGTSNLDQILSKALERISPAKREEPRSSATRFVPVSLKRALFKRDGCGCSYPGCKETRFLQFDHVLPYALGGKTELGNLRLLCSGHNRMLALRAGLGPPSGRPLAMEPRGETPTESNPRLRSPSGSV